MDFVVVLLVTFSTFGVIGNVLFAITLFKKPFSSKITNVLMSSQCVYDAFASCIYLAGRFLPSYQGSPFQMVDIAVCYIWTSQVFYWVLVMCSVQTLVWIAIDRYYAVIRPTDYLRIQRTLIINSQVFIIVLSILTVTPTAFDKKYENGTCTDGVLFSVSYYIIHKKIYATFWYACFYGLPIVLFVFVYSRISLKMWKTRKLTCDRSGARKVKVKVTLTAIVFTVQFICLFSVEPNHYLLSAYGYVEYIYFGQMQQIEVLLISISTSINPIICMILLRSRRNVAINIYLPCLSNKSAICSSRNDTYKVMSRL